MEHNQSSIKRTRVFLVFGVLLLSAISAFWTLSERPINNHECFVSITAREMLQNKNWVMPTCNGEPRLQKTPLSYWLVAGAAQITGGVDEFTARLPSAVFGVLSVAAILYFVNRWLSFRVAVLSACVWMTSLGYIRYSHNARPEMSLTFFVTLCFLSFYSAVNAKTRKEQIIQALVFWMSFGLANLAKGPAPIPLVTVPLFFYILITRQWKVLPKLLPVTGVIVFLAIALPWPLAIAHQMNWDMTVWKHEFVDRFFGNYAPGNKPFYYYLPRMFMFIAPWVVFLPMALAAPFYKVWDRKRGVMIFLWTWFVADFVFLTINGGKRQHYIMPTMPAVAILIGILIEDMIFVRRAFTLEYAKNLLRNHIAVIIAGAVAAPPAVLIAAAVKDAPLQPARTDPQLFAAALILSVVAITAAVIIAVLFAKGKPAYACGAVFIGISVLVMIAYSSLINPLNYNEPSRQFTQIVAQKVPPSDKLIAHKSASTRFIHYFGRRVPKIETKSQTYELYGQGRWVVAFGAYLDELLDDGRFEVVYLQKSAERHKQNIVAGALLHKSKEHP